MLELVRVLLTNNFSDHCSLRHPNDLAILGLGRWNNHRRRPHFLRPRKAWREAGDEDRGREDVQHDAAGGIRQQVSH